MAGIQIKNLQKQTPIDLRLVRRTVSAILALVSESASTEISIVLLDDARIADLNGRYRQRPGPTDVLSFPQADPDFPHIQPGLLGDVVISVETATRQAGARGCTLHQELCALLVHGILHLLGHDHEQGPAAARQMRTRERRVLTSLAADEKIGPALAAGP